eukprot:6325643-Alexandrium_andersonii.AAC.1
MRLRLVCLRHLCVCASARFYLRGVAHIETQRGCAVCHNAKHVRKLLLKAPRTCKEKAAPEVISSNTCYRGNHKFAYVRLLAKKSSLFNTTVFKYDGNTRGRNLNYARIA